MDYSLYDMVDAPVFVLVADDHDRPVFDFMNLSCCRLLEMDLPDIVGKAVHEILDGRAAYAVYRQQLKAWKNGVTTEFEVGLPFGDKTMWFRTCLVASHDEDRHLVRMVGTSHDITAERALSHQEAMTAAAIREIEDMVCLAAHDLRSPIGNLKSLAYLMRSDFVDHGDGKLELIDMIDDIADKSLTVISETMAQVMARSDLATVGSVDLGSICDDLVVFLDPLRQHSVIYPRVLVEADIAAVQIVLRNLLDNGFKHAGDGAARVEVSVAQVNARRLALSVRDHGHVTQDAALDGESDPLVDSAFGLRSVMRLVQARGGTFSISRPEDGPGTDVRVELPGRMLDTEHRNAAGR